MNPEFHRNLWLELTPRRIVFMLTILALIFFAAGISDGEYSPASAARVLYYLIVIVWGGRNAGLSVVGEIRDRTWDSQRLSSVSAVQMTWGKLFGSTVYNWFGGAICLLVLLVSGVARGDILNVLIDLAYLVAAGVIAQSASLLASLIAVRRRQQHSRLEVFLYQLAGLVAATAVFYVWTAADPAGSLLMGREPTDFVVWWGALLNARPFLLVSLVLFAGWILVGCYREMRRELKLQNGPFVWLGFLGFIGLYVAGFDAWLTQNAAIGGGDVVALRLALAATTFGGLAYLMVLLEPKDRVLYRWYASQIVSGHVGRALWGLQAWIMSFIATAILSIGLIVWFGLHGGHGDYQGLVASGLGFLTRDVAIFVLFSTFAGRRQGDFPALLILFVLYALLPAILAGLDLYALLPFFHPAQTTPGWTGPIVVWIEAVAVLALAAARLSLNKKARA